jgi:hypothetical protein
MGTEIGEIRDDEFRVPSSEFLDFCRAVVSGAEARRAPPTDFVGDAHALDHASSPAPASARQIVHLELRTPNSDLMLSPPVSA